MVMTKKKDETTINEVRQLEYFAESPDEILPRTKPTGLPAPSAPVALFLLQPSGYVAKRIPIAGGDIAAVPSPSKPQRTFMIIALGAKAAVKEDIPRNAMPASNCVLRPKLSAVFPKNNMKEPLARLGGVSNSLLGSDGVGADPIAAAIQVTWGGVIFKSLPIPSVLIIMAPWMNVWPLSA